jgi:hypothetical protein
VSDDRDDPLFGPPDEPNVPSAPSGPTEPIRPPDPGTAPIPDRVRQPIVVPHKESTIAGLPRPFVIAAVVALVIVFVLGFFIGHAWDGDGQSPTSAAGGSRRAACERAVALSLQVSELQRQALANRTETAQAVAIGDESKVQELNAGLEPLAAAIQDTEAQLAPAVERCQSGGGGAKGGGKGKGGGKNAGKG